jgi:hypothetical protein
MIITGALVAMYLEPKKSRRTGRAPPSPPGKKQKHTASGPLSPPQRTRLDILHLVEENPILTRRMTPQTSQTVMNVFKSSAQCENLEQFTYESDHLVEARYKHATFLEVQQADNPNQQSRIEVLLYRAIYDVVKGLERGMPLVDAHPWPYIYDTQLEGRKEYSVAIYYDLPHEVSPEDVAFHVLVNEDDAEHGLSAKDPSPVRKLAAKYWYSKRWFHGAGRHHRTRRKAHVGAGATARHQEAHRAKAIRREKLSRELEALVNEVEETVPNWKQKYKKVTENARKLVAEIQNK